MFFIDEFKYRNKATNLYLQKTVKKKAFTTGLIINAFDRVKVLLNLLSFQ